MSSSFCLGSSNYNTPKLVSLSKICYCDICKIESENVITTDTSDGEYGGISLCEKCILRTFKDFKENKIKSTKNCKQCNDLFYVKEVQAFCQECYEWFEQDDFSEDKNSSDYTKEDFSSLEAYFEAKRRVRRERSKKAVTAVTASALEVNASTDR